MPTPSLEYSSSNSPPSRRASSKWARFTPAGKENILHLCDHVCTKEVSMPHTFKKWIRYSICATINASRKCACFPPADRRKILDTQMQPVSDVAFQVQSMDEGKHNCCHIVHSNRAQQTRWQHSCLHSCIQSATSICCCRARSNMCLCMCTCMCIHIHKGLSSEYAPSIIQHTAHKL